MLRSFDIIAGMIAENKHTLPIQTLENDLISLRPLDESDFEPLYAVASDPLIWELHPSKDRYKREVFQAFFDGAVQSQAAFLVFDKATDSLIGSTRYYDFKPEISTVAIGYTFLARAYWGGAYNKAMKQLMLDYAFANVDTVLFHIGTQNIRSQKAILKIGARFVREVDFDYYEKKLLHYEYEITKKDWVSKKAPDIAGRL
jgi:RimJ/RimL family protein N-acetyltransferase